MDIMFGLSAANEALKLVNELRKIDNEFDKAELKLRFIELADKLMDMKQALMEAQDERRDLQLKIDAAEERLRLKVRLQDENGCLYELDNEGRTVGAPFCNQCYVKEEKLYRLLEWDTAIWRCANCTSMLVKRR